VRCQKIIYCRHAIKCPIFCSVKASPTPEADEDGDPEEDEGDGNPNGLGVELENGILGAAYLLQSPRVRNRDCLVPLLAFPG
jgi:hypothetical protein